MYKLLISSQVFKFERDKMKKGLMRKREMKADIS